MEHDVRLVIIILCTILLLQISIRPSFAVEEISATNITARGSIGRIVAPSAALTTIMANIEERIYVENVERHGLLGIVLAPTSALTTIMTNIEQRIYVENVERHDSIGVVARPPSNLVDMLRMDVPLKPAEVSELPPTISPTLTSTPLQLTPSTISEAPTPVVTATVVNTSSTSPTAEPSLTTTPTP